MPPPSFMARHHRRPPSPPQPGIAAIPLPSSIDRIEGVTNPPPLLQLRCLPHVLHPALSRPGAAAILISSASCTLHCYHPSPDPDKKCTVLGFGANMITVAAVLVLGVNKRNATTTRNIRIGLLEKVLLYILPAFGACLSFYEMFLLMKSSLEGHNVEYHDWLFRCSQFVSWMTVLLVSQFRYWFHVFCNPILCCWWILKPVLEIPLLLTTFSSFEVITCLKESSSIFAEFMFGLFVIVVKAMHASKVEREFDSIEDPLLSHGSVERKDHIIDACSVCMVKVRALN
ncbi:hypothetical protein COCNU_01G004990 [Cocos nucifera]|uniref:Uncharacterized protein n=1 Tax=Cocos nucifera TaxID=13894 RepID=A0A8K0HU13_COCNU|nr:hypothetical protein COCNU_01G004990 [Cocos nucifera]